MSDTARGASRREVMLAVAGGTAATLAGCSTKAKPSNVPLSRRSAGADTDVALLSGLLGLERYAIAAYSAAIPLLDRTTAKAGIQFLAHELAHASEVEGLIVQAGGQPPKPPASFDLGNPRAEHDLLELLHSAERAQLAGYLGAIPRVRPPRIRAALAAIFSNEAQHAAVLRARLGLAPVPSALVSGLE